MNWYDALKTLVKAVAEGKSGQVGTFEFRPPDERVAVVLSGGLFPDRSCVFVTTADPNGTEKVQTFPADKSDEAVDAYVAAVEGSS